MALNIHKGKRRLPPRLLVYGPEGIGKSSFAASAPKPLIISTETGLGEIDCDSVECDSFAAVMEVITELAKDQQGYQSVAIDTLDWTERQIWQGICDHYGKPTMELSAGGYGKAFTEAISQWWAPMLSGLNALRQQGMCVILLAHAKVEKFEDPENPTYDRWSPRLHKLATALICEWVDATLFATRRMYVDEKEGSGKMVAKPIGGSGGDRILRCIGGPACVAKNRYGMPDEIPLSWEAFEQYPS